MPYNYLIVGAGLFGATFANLARKAGKSVLVIDKRNHIGGNCYTENTEGINVHKYGAHIFHTSNKEVWDFVNSFVKFNNFVNSPIAISKGKRYNLPFNMNTFHQLWGVHTPDEAKAKIEEQRASAGVSVPQNLEEQALSLVGKDVYETLIKEYTEKQWGRKCSDLPASIIKRLPIRFTFDNNYFNDSYQGIPIGGYTTLVEKMLEGIEVRLNTDFIAHRTDLNNIAGKIIFTGPIDEFFDYKFGPLEYRSLKFETEVLDTSNFQGNAVVNYIDRKYPYTRIIEHQYFEFGNQSATVITYEYPDSWELANECVSKKDSVVIGDIGSGGGLPGIPLAASLPQFNFVLVERMSKRCAFLENCAAILGLKNVTVKNVEAERVESESIDIAVFRAFRPLDKKMIKTLLNMLPSGGKLAAYKAKKDKIVEEMSAINYPDRSYEVIPLEVPFLTDTDKDARERNLVVVEK